MKCFLPIDITFNSINVDYSLDPAIWSSATAYVVDDEVTFNDKTYIAIADNTNAQPDLNLFDGTSGYWLETGVVNKLKMIDDKVNTQTVATNTTIDGADTIYDIDFEFNSNGIISAIAFFNVDAESINIKQYDANTDTLVYENTISLADSGDITSWEDYFFEDFSFKTDVVENLYLYNSKIQVNIQKKNAPAKVGVIACGMAKDLGLTLYSPTVNILDFSKKDTDDWGNTYLKQGNFKKYNSLDVLMNSNSVGRVFRLLESLRGKRAVYIGNKGYEPLMIYGFFKDFSIIVENQDYSNCSLEIEGLI